MALPVTLIDLHRQLTHALPLAGSRLFGNGPTRAELRHEAAWAESLSNDLAELYRVPVQEVDRLPETAVLLLAYILNQYRNPTITTPLRNTLVTGIVGGVNIGGQAALQMLGLPGVFNLTNPRLIAEANQWAITLVDPESTVSLTRTTAKELTAKIMSLREEGLTSDEIKVGISEWIDGRSVVRAGNIAQNETVRADRTGLVETYERNGIARVTFRTRGDAAVDGGNPQGPCAIRAGVVYSVGSAPEIPLHYGCRCWYEAVTDEWQRPETPWIGA